MAEYLFDCMRNCANMLIEQNHHRRLQHCNRNLPPLHTCSNFTKIKNPSKVSGCQAIVLFFCRVKVSLEVPGELRLCTYRPPHSDQCSNSNEYSGSSGHSMMRTTGSRLNLGFAILNRALNLFLLIRTKY